MLRKGFILILIAVFAFACATTTDDAPNDNRKTKRGATIGAVAGAVVGAAVGAAVGGAIGRRMDKQAEELKQIEDVQVEHTPGTDLINVRLRNDVLFDFNSSDLRSESRDTLGELADNFRQYPDNQIIVEGHTDSVGSEEYNQGLSERRAASVADFLIERGVDANDIVVYGYGEMCPKASNDTAEGRQLNRRVEINIRADQTSG